MQCKKIHANYFFNFFCFISKIYGFYIFMCLATCFTGMAKIWTILLPSSFLMVHFEVKYHVMMLKTPKKNIR